MKKTKINLRDFHGSRLHPNQLKHIRGGIETVPPQGDPGDIRETTFFLKPQTETTSPYLDPNPNPDDMEFRP
jgi:hypothetical protein